MEGSSTWVYIHSTRLVSYTALLAVVKLSARELFLIVP